MEKNKLTTRDKLKTYFETGKYPTQSQFSDLIDLLRLKEDILTNRELVTLANSLEAIENTFIYYFASNVKGLKLPIVISSEDEEDQIITFEETLGDFERRYLFGSAPYTIRVKEFLGGKLNVNEYYNLEYQLDRTYTITRLFGNNLQTIPDGFELGVLSDKKMSVGIYTRDFGKQINIINTDVRFNNNTEIPIRYRIESQYWGDGFKAEDTVTDHYDLWDYLFFYYDADLSGSSQSVNCEIYDADNNKLLSTTSLLAGQSSNSWGGSQYLREIRNIRIECSYHVGEK
ncbi:hypothetical protein [Chryseobacterium geocarposphaerae]|uniref:Uncharacterized protein n=1 Tax=Chryseobacterium geocarposphaerae TaxID=1416776 RepID=A0A2M9C9D2_9FLAO|nr:hypothetical protein [Chryseobacterium geocarposphaerae]PJJ67449.1 hypothetical protein CLV73_1462 [Chryseobacterium geocarposphaerae]